ncbi:MAG: hypothetical protein K9N11_07655 [Lentisphaeria bacterium]|nr:hypothetical protein [Candidatus Neomarinimicrobiota bacterium]MCF7842711.1 hypothetical protein [Lentisphaeria bacterium]
MMNSINNLSGTMRRRVAKSFQYFLLCVILVPGLQGREILTFFAGYSSYPASTSYADGYYEVHNGVTFGFMIPIHFPVVDVHYKIGAGYHPAEVIGQGSNAERQYIAASNVFLVGKWAGVWDNRLRFLPQIGLGLLYENIYDEWGRGYLFDQLYIDYTMRLSVPQFNDRIQFMLNYEDGFASSGGFAAPDKRLKVSFLIRI